MLPQRPNLCLERCPRPEQIDHRPTNESTKIPHPTTGLPDSRSTASRTRFATGTGCRREDVVRLGPQHIKNERLRYTQAKNEHRNPIDIDIPVHSDLAKAIAASSSGHMTFLATPYGKPYTAAGFGNKFRQWCEADLPQCSSHGLRKATATRLAERGASAHEIMAVTGHRSLSEVERYTKEANKPKLATQQWPSSNEEH